MERETPELVAPATFLRGEEGASPESVRARFERMIRRVQAEVCAELEAVEGGVSDGCGAALFREDAWTRPGGGGGISHVLQGGRVFEKAAVNISVVYGVMPPEAYRAARPEAAAAAGGEKAKPVPFFAAGVSSVIHPVNPFAPTMHFNYRYFETEAPKDIMEDDAPFSADAPGAPRQWWFGGGTDLTPSYIIEEDIKHFHSICQCLLHLLNINLDPVQKQVCDKFDPSFYPRFKKWCDDYFYIKHRGERRGVGGIFFDDLSDYDQETLLQFATECADSVLPAYIPIIERRKDIPFTEEHKAWQQLRRGRYVEFNLKPEVGSEEWKLLDTCINPKEWI
ncbi:oxygen-dependent coproporphyrinogen-III oxidase, chloroplastic-like [Panicum miliaceum]|uniref:Oxygen-dependent coproporphyrinogen-III oxidase, chloroplastic-like n=1 Tax=Panicum miliaceum TaxID=4540 RepID=A0A3L6PP43_PANMI|nr:oxygen-dependent coproporphyrinogen-III oxidase, chloroplastic-like [Panicum miliaceum]